MKVYIFLDEDRLHLGVCDGEHLKEVTDRLTGWKEVIEVELNSLSLTQDINYVIPKNVKPYILGNEDLAFSFEQYVQIKHLTYYCPTCKYLHLYPSCSLDDVKKILGDDYPS